MADDEELEAVYRELVRGFEPNSPAAPDRDAAANPRLDYLTPQQRDWWVTHADSEPTLILRCGIDGCGKGVGEVRTDETNPDIVIALMYSRFGERPVPTSPYRKSDLSWAQEMQDASGKTLAEAISERVDREDADTLRDVGEGKRIAKRYDAPSTVLPLNSIGFITCQEHGIRRLPDPDKTIDDMRAFLANTKHASKRRYVIFRGA